MAVIRNITGVIDDGSPLGSDVPSNPRRYLSFPQKSDVLIRLQILSRSGAKYNFASGDIATLYITLSPQMSPIFKKEVTAAPSSDGRVDFVIAPNDTRMIQWSRILYEVRLFQLASGHTTPIIPLSPLVLEATAA